MFKLSFFSLLFVISIFYGCSSSKVNPVSKQPDTLTHKEKNNGWVLLFNGKTTNGWHTYNQNSVTKN